MTQVEPLQPQTLAGGRYLLVEPLGEGGMATVYRAFDQRLQVWRAIKVLNPRYSSSKKIKQRFDAEAQTMALLEHPNIVRVYDVGSIGDISYIVMEIVEGGSLVDWLERNGAMPAGLALRVTEQICHGITAAHSRGVIHRDIKPHNILVTLDGTCRVTDFGIARVGDGDVSLTKTGAVMGTWGYMAPEQRSDAKNVDVRADVYAIAATLYTLVTNRIPMDLFAADRDKSVMNGVPEAVYDVLIRATDYQRDNRYPDVEALRVALLEAASRLPPDPSGTPPLVLRKPERREPPTPDTIARAVPLVPEGPGPQLPTLLPNTLGATSGATSSGGETPAPNHRYVDGPAVGDLRAEMTVDLSEQEPHPPPAPRRSPLVYVAPILVGLVGLLFLAGAGAVVAPMLLRRPGPVVATDTGEDPSIPPAEVPVDPPQTPPEVAVAAVDPAAPTAPTVGTPNPGERRPPGPKNPTTPAASGTATPDSGSPTTPTNPGPPDTPVGTASPETPVGGEEPKQPAPTVTVVPVKSQCVDVAAPGSASIGGNLQIQATLCNEDPAGSVTLWYRPRGSDAWQAVGMPLRLGARRAIIKVDDRFAGGLDYYVETDGATAGSRSNPRHVAVQ